MIYSHIKENFSQALNTFLAFERFRHFLLQGLHLLSSRAFCFHEAFADENPGMHDAPFEPLGGAFAARIGGSNVFAHFLDDAQQLGVFGLSGRRGNCCGRGRRRCTGWRCRGRCSRTGRRPRRVQRLHFLIHHLGRNSNSTPSPRRKLQTTGYKDLVQY